ncbi:hypothetical protein JYU34_018955 [Plutella xylostella]|uniref:C2H2-type domain-containing protein n=1 Tax=Plutella xylostella TaxID=51655 RepID=A0ABQ7Q0D3_PLUXY|nr:hypothetical protein JYU34_018955 [Plutella xylostella]
MCGAEFGILGYWRRHVRCMHNGQRLPVCRECVLAFDTRGGLARGARLARQDVTKLDVA